MKKTKLAPAPVGKTGIQFFGVCDYLDESSKPCYPSWFLKGQINTLEEEINVLGGMLARDEFLTDEQAKRVRDRVRRLRGRYEEIVSSKPRLLPGDKDRLHKLRKTLEAELRDNMPPYSEVMRGTADIEEILEKNKGHWFPCGEFHDVLSDLNCKIGEGGRIGMDDMSRTYSIISELLDEDPRPEKLRRDYSHGTAEFHKTLEELFREYSR